MGSAAYNRGSAALSREIDRELEEKRPAMERRELSAMVNELQLKLLAARQEIERQESRSVRLAGLLRRQRAVTVAGVAKFRARHDSLRGQFSRVAEVMVSMRRRWQFTSWIIRYALSPEDYHRAREEFERAMGS